MEKSFFMKRMSELSDWNAYIKAPNRQQKCFNKNQHSMMNSINFSKGLQIINLFFFCLHKYGQLNLRDMNFCNKLITGKEIYFCVLIYPTRDTCHSIISTSTFIFEYTLKMRSGNRKQSLRGKHISSDVVNYWIFQITEVDMGVSRILLLSSKWWKQCHTAFLQTLSFLIVCARSQDT